MEYNEILGLPPKEILFRLLRKHSDFDARGVTLDKLTFGDAVVSDAFNRDTALPVHPQPGSGLVNSVTVYYNRINLSKLGNQVWPLEIETLASMRKITEVLPTLASTYGIMLEANDIVDGDLDQSTYPVQVTITPKPGNPVWTGTMQLEIGSGRFDLNNLVRNNILTGLHYLQGRDSDKLPGPLISYNWFVPAEAVAGLTDGFVLTQGNNIAEGLITALNLYQIGLMNEMEGITQQDEWVLSGTPSALNLQNAEVIADTAKFASLPFGVRTDVSQAYVLQLSVMNTLIDGYLTLYVQ